CQFYTRFSQHVNINTPSPGWNTITANSGPVGTNQNRIVVFRQQVFYFEQEGGNIYYIYPNGAGSVQASLDNRLVIEQGFAPQPWLIEQYDNEENTFIIRSLNGLAWTDGGGSPGPNHQLYLNAFDPNNVPAAQQFTIRHPLDIQATNQKRR
ncbi:hypothetical protein J3A83DRAFT_4272954, partial [Scleroderma citrinum]